MDSGLVSTDRSLAEICFDGDVGDLIRAVDPTAVVSSRLTCTTLWHRQAGAEDLDRLLDDLSQFGIAPLDVHRGGDDHRRGDCEVIVPGRLGRALLHHLGWSHRVSPVTVARLSLTVGLGKLLDALGSRATVRYVICE